MTDDAIRAYESENLLGTGTRHGFFTRKGGVSKGLYAGLNVGLGSNDEEGAVIENRRLAVCSLKEEAALATPYQVHGNAVAVVDAGWTPDNRPRVDALVTRQAGVALGIVTADCVPVLLSDQGAGVIGAAHAGWKGALGGVLENTITTMIDQGASRDGITAAVGPAISQTSYEVGPELKQAYVAQDTRHAVFFEVNDQGRHQFDLVGFVISVLGQAGIESVGVEARDTYALPEEFYSFRRATHLEESDYGRQLSAIIRVRTH